MSALVVGGSGFLGGEVVRQLSAAGYRVAATYLTQPPDLAAAWHAVDVRDRRQVADLVTATRPDVVINAAYRKADWSTTADGAAHVATAAASVAARLVHVSSDAVFSGAAIRYDEAARPDPTTPYGAAKAAAETAVAAVDPAAVIVRTSLIIGDGGSVHERRVHDLVEGRETGVLSTDDVRCPVHVADLAAALLELATSEHTGIHHVAGTDAVSRYELATLIAVRDGLDAAALPSGRRVGPGSPGPVDVRLECPTTQQRLRTRLRGAREFLGRRVSRGAPGSVGGPRPGSAPATGR